MVFVDREDAGHRLGQALEEFRTRNPVVLGLPRGGVVVGFQVAQALKAPLDVIVARKLGVPGHEEFAMGAIAQDVVILNDLTIHRLGVPPRLVDGVIAGERQELGRREALYRHGRPAVELQGRTVIVADDGIATGATAAAAITAVRKRRPAAIVLAVPVCSREAHEELSRIADRVVALSAPDDFGAVGQWYQDFRQATDDEVIALLERANDLAPAMVRR